MAKIWKKSRFSRKNTKDTVKIYKLEQKKKQI